MAFKSNLPTKAIFCCCRKYRLKPDDLSCFPKVGTTQAVVLVSNVLLSGEPNNYTAYHSWEAIEEGYELKAQKRIHEFRAVSNTTYSQVKCTNKGDPSSE